MGRYSSHAIVFARLLVDDKDYKVQPFIVHLRDLQTWKHLKGVETGDLGPKYGYITKDNGWAKFNQVRIPRRNMLMGVASVDKGGSFRLKGDARVLYSTMMLIRMTIITDVPNYLLSALQIALRYASVRR